MRDPVDPEARRIVKPKRRWPNGSSGVERPTGPPVRWKIGKCGDSVVKTEFRRHWPVPENVCWPSGAEGWSGLTKAKAIDTLISGTRARRTSSSTKRSGPCAHQNRGNGEIWSHDDG